MTIKNALASVAVKDIDAAVQWYAKVLARPADSTPMPGLAEWKFPGGGRLQVYALPECARSCSCTLTVSDIDLEASRLEKLGVTTGSRMGEQGKVFMVKDPDGNSIAFTQAQSLTTTKDAVSIARAAYEAHVSKDRAAIEALIADDFHFTSPLDNRLDRATYFARCWPRRRGATTAFVQRNIGDVLVTFENEVQLIKQEYGADKFDIAYPPVSIVADLPVSVVDKVVDKRGTRKVAEAYLQHLYSPEAQDIAAQHELRPRDPAILAKYSSTLPPLKLFTVNEVFGSLKQAQAVHFKDGGLFDQIYSRK